jgi:hypothetical protein
MAKNLLALSLGIAMSIGILLIAEGFFRLNRSFHFLEKNPVTYKSQASEPVLMNVLAQRFKQSKWSKTNIKSYLEVESKLPSDVKVDYSKKFGESGFGDIRYNWSILKPNIKYRSIVTLEKYQTLLYDITIEIDEKSRRKVEQNPTSKDQGILFFGDSFTYGEGVEDADTYPSQFAKLNPDFQIYNYGIGGSSPSHYLQEIEVFPEYRYVGTKMPSRNIGIYLIIDDTIERVIYRMGSIRSRPWIRELPYYDLDSKGRPRLMGNFKDNRQTLNLVYSFFAGSALLDFFNVDFPPDIRQSDLDFMAVIMKTYWDHLKKFMPMDRFIVVSYPESVINPLKYKKAFEKVGIEFWDLSQARISEISGQRDHIPWDRHPNEIAYYLLAEILTYKLKTTK